MDKRCRGHRWAVWALVALTLWYTPASPTAVAAEAESAWGRTAPKEVVPPGKVAYIHNGALWVRELPAGRPKRLWTGTVSHPRWSPSGRWLAVNEGDRIRVLPVGWRTRGMGLEGSGATWSPAADRLAFQDSAGNLVVVDAQRNLRAVVAEAATYGPIVGHQWSPDGRSLAFLGDPSAPGSPPGARRPDPSDRLPATTWTVGVDGGNPTEAVRAPSEEQTCLQLAGWSPDSREVLYWQVPLCSASILSDGVPLFAVPAGGGAPRRLVEAMLTHPGAISGSPQGNQIAVMAGAGRMTWHNKTVEVLDLTGGTALTLSPPGYAAGSPAFSPDGGQVAFVAMPDAGPDVGGGGAGRQALMQRRIWAAGIEGGQARQLTPEAAYRDEAPQWIPAGILFARLSDEDSPSLWLYSPKDAAVREVDAVDAPPNAWFGYYGWLDWPAVFAVHSP